MVEPLLAGSSQALPAGLADGFASMVVFVVGGNVADRFVEAHGVVFVADAGQLGVEELWVGDRAEVGPLVF